MKTVSFSQLQATLIKLKKIKTLRWISDDVYKGKVTHGTIDRCIKGIEPKDEEIREALSLPQVVAQEWYRDEKGRRIKTPKEE